MKINLTFMNSLRLGWVLSRRGGRENVWVLRYSAIRRRGRREESRKVYGWKEEGEVGGYTYRWKEGMFKGEGRYMK